MLPAYIYVYIRRARESRARKRSRKPFAVFGCHLAVIATKSGGDAWESNPPRTPQQRTANGFEDRGAAKTSTEALSTNSCSVNAPLRRGVDRR